MHLIYYDEVKFGPPEQPSYWLGGVCVAHELVPEIEAKISAIAERAFGSAVLNKDTEIHGIELCRGKGNFKGRDFGERLELLKELLAIVAREDVMLIRVKVNPANITHSSDSPADIAFMFFVEKVDDCFAPDRPLACCLGTTTSLQLVHPSRTYRSFGGAVLVGQRAKASRISSIPYTLPNHTIAG